jgi:uncharacterized YccA/Bax inhibitor family protein
MPTQDVTIRKAPRFTVFVGTGAILGILAAAIATFTFPVDPAVGALATWGFFSIMFSLVGMGIFATIALVVDRRTRSHSATARVTKKKP